MRAFIAIDLDREIKGRLSSLVNALDRGDRKIKWIKDQGMHLTLKFLGDISPDQREKIERALDKIAAGSESFEMNLSGTGYFPPYRKRPRILWCGIEAGGSLKAIQASVESEMERLGFPREKREFHPHITLGRIKIPQGLDPVIDAMEDYSGRPFGSMTVKHLTLFKSTLLPTGAEYSILHEVDLK